MNPTTAKICYRLTLGYRRRYDNKSCIGIGLQSLRHALFHLITVMTLVKSLDSTAFQSPVIEMGYKKSKKKKRKGKPWFYESRLSDFFAVFGFDGGFVSVHHNIGSFCNVGEFHAVFVNCKTASDG